MNNSDYKIVALKDISVDKGKYGLAAAAVDKDANLPTYLRITDITDDGELITENLKSVDDDNHGNYFLKENDIVIARTGASTGRAFFYESKYGKLVYAGFLIKFSLDEKKVNPKFMKYYTISDEYRNWIKAYTGGSTRGNINAVTLGNMKLVIPSRKQQDFLVSILEKIDEIIQINNSINTKIKSLIRLLYNRWFVDFEYPNEAGKPYKSSGGEMVESEIGKIPKEWEIKNVLDLFDFVGGSQPPKKDHIYEKKDGYVRFVQNRDYNGTENHLTYIRESKKNKICDELDIMMDKYGEAGKVRFGIAGAYNVALAKVQTTIDDREFIRRYFEQQKIEKYIFNSSQASTRPSVNRSVFTNLKIAYPTKDIKDAFSEISRDVVHKILGLKKENAKLAELRDFLLPKLISGEISAS